MSEILPFSELFVLGLHSQGSDDELERVLAARVGGVILFTRNFVEAPPPAARALREIGI